MGSAAAGLLALAVLAVMVVVPLNAASVLSAVCVMGTTDGVVAPSVNGTILLTQSDAAANVTFSGTVSNLPPSVSLGLHVHVYGDLSTATSTGGHFNPTNVAHGCWPSNARHNGDIGNITTNAAGQWTFPPMFSRNLLSLVGNASAVGRALVIHTGGDLCTGATGNAGSRLAHCVIGLRNPGTVDENVAGFAQPVPPRWAVAKISALAGQDASGFVWFRQANLSRARVYARYAASPVSLTVLSVHGFHVHYYGDLSDATGPGTANSAGANTGSHWNPSASAHGLPPSDVRHWGDMGNVNVSASSTVVTNVDVDLLTLLGTSNIVGRAVVLHSAPDDGSQPTGNAGTKLAVGVVGYANGPPATAYVALASTSAGASAAGAVTLTQTAGPGDLVTFSGTLTGLTPGPHALFIYAWGDVTAQDGSRTGELYNPSLAPHNCYPNANRSAGIVGSIVADASGTYTFPSGFTRDLLDLSGPRSIVGRALVVMEADDPLCGGSAASAGAIVASGVIAVATAASSLSVNAAEFESYDEPLALRAIVSIKGLGLTPEVNGVMYLEQTSSGVLVYSQVRGMALGSTHGFHVHEFGQLSDVNGTSAGSHFNPTFVPHALPPTEPRHLGDWGNMVVHADGTAYVFTTFPGTLGGLDSLPGHALVIHSLADTGAQPTGAAGSRVAAGVIGICGPDCWPSTIFLPAKETQPSGLSPTAIAIICACVIVSLVATAAFVVFLVKACKKPAKSKSKGSKLAII